MEEKKVDRRIRKTRQAFRKALLKLLQEKPFEKISVTDLTNQADIARITFYKHYDSKEALLLSIVKGFFENFFERFTPEVYLSFLESGKLDSAAQLAEQEAISLDSLRLLGLSLKVLGPELRKLAIESFLRANTDDRLSSHEQYLLASYHTGGAMALMESFFLGNLESGLELEKVRIVPWIFLRALHKQLTEEQLLHELLSSDVGSSS